MSAPFDTLQLARGFEAAGFPLDQASKMAEAVAQATIGADLATKADLAPLATKADVAALVSEAKFELVKGIVGIAIAQVGTVIAVLKLFPATGHG
jgi:hypothetical protein